MPYHKDLGYVLGSSRTTDAMLIIILPHIYTEVHLNRRQIGKLKVASVRWRPKPRAVFFNPEGMVVCFGDAVMAFHIADGQGFSEVFTNRFSNWVTDKGIVLDVTKFDWVEGYLSQRSMYQFEGELFYCGLAILPIYGYSAVKRVVVPLSKEVVAFAESHIDSIGYYHSSTGKRVIMLDVLMASTS